MASTNSASCTLDVPQPKILSRDLAELILGFLGIMVILWLPTHQQLIFGPIALLAPLLLVLLRRPGLNELGLGWKGLVSSLWILLATTGISWACVLLAQEIGSFHALYEADLAHVGGYVLWTLYQQFLLQDYFMPRLSRMLTSNTAIGVAAVLFATAHLPNVPLMLASLVWGLVSCWLFRRYRNLYVLGIAQGLLGLSVAVCIPDSMLHHMRVGLGYSRYHPI